MVTNFIKEVRQFFEEVLQKDLRQVSLQELQKQNDKMLDFFANPIVCKHDSEDDRVYSTIIESILNSYGHFVRKTEYVKIYMGFIDDVLDSIPQGVEKTKEVAIDFYNDVSRGVSIVVKRNTVVDEYYNQIILNDDLDTYNYLYYYGEKITENQLKTVDFFNTSVDNDVVTGMARCTIDAFFRGLKNANIDVEKKKYFVLAYPIGFEKVAKKVYELIDGKLEIIFRPIEVKFSKQVNYDHRYDYNFYLTDVYIDNYLDLFEKALEDSKERLDEYAGPVYIDSFGENRFIPVNGNEVFEKDTELAKKNGDFDTKFSNLFWKLVRNNTSFCIISYPCPEIGPDFEEIFKETIHINTLDNSKYVKIHQSIIDVLDKSRKVRITGRNGNKTDLTVCLTELNDPDKETIFENCCADVNVPVGEVFTSPKLTGTNGVLHVSEIYLDGWKFENLMLTIEDGYIKEYSCSNFKTKKENDEYINEHLLFDHETLPMGEFAIGTNTYAYVMGNKYKINDKLDILIAEKTGPHFAFGDTCFSMEEDNETFNPDGKKIIAKDNESSIKRKSEDVKVQEEAYFGCHTDVTIPYYELGDIVAIAKDGTGVSIIHEGKFVLRGTEELNIEGM